MNDKVNMAEQNLGGNQSPPQTPAPKNKKTGVFAYFFLPGIVPNIKELGRGGFGYLALLIASVYQAVRILPANHPYTKYENLGKFGIRQVIAAAANNIKFSKNNFDQIIIFFAILAGVIILALQLISFMVLLLSGQAWATTPDSFGGIFATQNPDEDIAFHMLREIFGIPDMFGTLENGQTTLHKALLTMFNFYNLAILLVAIIVFVYYVIVVVGETAESGTPFGQRFSHVYAPFRLVIAIGMLVPLNYGLNGAQYITLFAAKTGSGFATTGWNEFTKTLTNPLGAENITLIASTEPPDFTGLTEFMATVVACREAYDIRESKKIEPFCSTKSKDGKLIEPKSCGGPGAVDSIMSMGGIEPVKMAFDTEDNIGKKPPYCGTISIPVNVPEDMSAASGDPAELQRQYGYFVLYLWDDERLKEMGKNFADARDIRERAFVYGNSYVPPSNYKNDVSIDLKAGVDSAVTTHYADARENADFNMREETKKLGWGGAGIWYNRIAQINGAYVVTTMNIPAGELRPVVMEKVLEAKRGADGAITGCNAFEPNLANNDKVTFTPNEFYYARVLNEVYQYWGCDKKNANNFFLDSLSSIFGLEGLMSIRETVDGKNSAGEDIKVQIHPLAKLSALGRGLVESAVTNMGYAFGTSFVGGMVGVLAPNLGASLQAASSMFVSIATIGLSIGFITYYILPFLPFMYFFFALGGWVKSIFEAMVGAPLWALAHLRIDGDGLPGKSAMNGYFLIFEIFLRPILTVFGLLGGMATFTALAAILNEVFNLVVLSSGGSDLSVDAGRFEASMHVVDIFFFTTVYAVILYMMAVSSFKMITLVPNNILRWLGQSVSSFNDQSGDPTQGLTQYAAIGGARIGGQLLEGTTQLGGAAGGVPGGVFGLFKGKQ